MSTSSRGIRHPVLLATSIVLLAGLTTLGLVAWRMESGPSTAPANSAPLEGTVVNAPTDGKVSVQVDRDIPALNVYKGQVVDVDLAGAYAPIPSSRIGADVAAVPGGFAVTDPGGVVTAPPSAGIGPATGFAVVEAEGRGGRTCQDLVTNPCGARISGT